MIEHIIGVLAPHECISCHSEGLLLCISCQRSLPVLPVLPWVHNGYLGAATIYEAAAKDIIYRLKFERARAAAKVVAAVMAQRLPLDQAGVITHVPTATTRQRVRGYDQAALIARELAALLHVRYTPLLERMGQQRQLGHSRHDRQQQLAGAFRPISAEMARGEHVLLIDDVLTTGSTLDAAASVLMRTGAAGVSAYVFARA
jgi:ComF family protein